MKYGESAFDIIYLIFAIVCGCIILAKSKNRTAKLMGLAAIVLGCGDAFHLVPRVLNYFVDKDFLAALGVGKLITSVTMTVFYILMYYIFLNNYEGQKNKGITATIWCLSAVRIALCLFPQNEWLSNSSPLLWGILRNIPFAILGTLIVILYFKRRNDDRCFRFIWLYVTLSFLFYIPVVVGADVVPILGALMLPKTVCYLLILFTFLKKKKNA